MRIIKSLGSCTDPGVVQLLSDFIYVIVSLLRQDIGSISSDVQVVEAYFMKDTTGKIYDQLKQGTL